jgi:hypothetical protein
MGLKDDIYDVFQKAMSPGKPLFGKQKSNVDTLSQGLTDAIVKFLVKQEFRITKLKSDLDVESIKTSGDIPATVKPDTTLGQYKPLVDALGMIPGASAVTDKIFGALEKNPIVKKVGENGVKVPRLNLNKNFGDGGTLTVKGNGIVDEPSNIKSPSVKSRQSTVKLFENEVKDK